MKQVLWTDVLKIALGAAVITLAFPEPSLAQALKDSVDEVKTGIKNIPVIVSGIAYFAGGATMLHGAGLLKKHADNPTSQALAPGVIRMCLGGAVAALPMLMGWITASLKSQGTNLGFTPLGSITGG